MYYVKVVRTTNEGSKILFEKKCRFLILAKAEIKAAMSMAGTRLDNILDKYDDRNYTIDVHITHTT